MIVSVRCTSPVAFTAASVNYMSPNFAQEARCDVHTADRCVLCYLVRASSVLGNVLGQWEIDDGYTLCAVRRSASGHGTPVPYTKTKDMG